jgi:hypothetical protein
MNTEPITIVPSRRLKQSASTWEILDNRNKLVGTFDTNKVTNLQAIKQRDKLIHIAQVKNIKNDLFDLRKRIGDLFLKNEDWQVCDRAMKAMSQTKDSIAELDLIVDHIKQS